MTDEEVAKMAAGWVRATEINYEERTKMMEKELQVDINGGLADDKKMSNTKNINRWRKKN